MRRRAVGVIVLVVSLAAAGCSSDDSVSTPTSGVGTAVSTSLAGSLFPDVLDVVATSSESGWRFDVTLSSPYDTPERYADAWRVVGADGTVFGVRELDHDHASEQPFTRSLTDVQIPDDVQNVVVEGRDQVNGYGGTTFEVALIRG